MSRTIDADAARSPAAAGAPAPPERAARRAGALVVAAAALLLLVRLGATGFWAPDEPRYGQIAEELRSFQHGPAGLVLLHIDGEPYTQKPPLYFWLAAAFGAPGGRVTEGAARLPSALAGIALVALVWRFGARWLAPASGTLGAALLLTTFEFSDVARHARLDVLLALLETAGLIAFWRIDRGVGRRAANQLLLHGALGLAVLTKGPVGFLVPALVMATFLAWERRLGDLRRAFPAWGLLLSLGPGLTWIAAAVALAPPGFFGEAVVDNLFGRFFAGTSHPRPFWYYLYQFPLALLPWALLLPLWIPVGRRVLAAEAEPGTRRIWRFLLAWVGAPLLFFTLSSGKRGLYLLPSHPAVALLVADALWRELARGRAAPRSLQAVSALLVAGLVGAGAWLAWRDPLGSPGAARVSAMAALAIAAALAAVVLVTRGRSRAPTGPAVAAPVAAVYATLLVFYTVTAPALDPGKSPRAIAEAAAALTPPDGAIGLVDDEALLGGIVYYGHRSVETLESRRQIARFLAAGGSAIVVQERKLDRVASLRPVEVRFRARGGRRTLVVVSPQRVEAPRVGEP